MVIQVQIREIHGNFGNHNIGGHRTVLSVARNRTLEILVVTHPKALSLSFVNVKVSVLPRGYISVILDLDNSG